MKNISNKVIEFADIHVYQTVSLGYRVYIRKDPDIESWGNSKNEAIRNLTSILIEKGIPFDFNEYYS